VFFFLHSTSWLIPSLQACAVRCPRSTASIQEGVSTVAGRRFQRLGSDRSPLFPSQYSFTLLPYNLGFPVPVQRVGVGERKGTYCLSPFHGRDHAHLIALVLAVRVTRPSGKVSPIKGTNLRSSNTEPLFPYLSCVPRRHLGTIIL